MVAFFSWVLFPYLYVEIVSFLYLFFKTEASFCEILYMVLISFFYHIFQEFFPFFVLMFFNIIEEPYFDWKIKHVIWNRFHLIVSEHMTCLQLYRNYINSNEAVIKNIVVTSLLLQCFPFSVCCDLHGNIAGLINRTNRGKPVFFFLVHLIRMFIILIFYKGKTPSRNYCPSQCFKQVFKHDN